MTSDSIERDSIRSVSPIVIDHSLSKTFFDGLACCKRTRQRKNTIQISQGFFQRIQSFKARKRQSSVRQQQQQQQQQLSDVSNEIQGQQYLPIEFPESPLMRTTRSISFLHPMNSPRPFSQNLETCSFADIEIASKSPTRAPTPKSMLSHHLSSMTTNLSACSTQSLLRKLLDKAQCLDEYYKEFSQPTQNHRWTVISTSSSSPLIKSDRTSNSRFELYPDEDNILRELVRFNTDINLILSRLNHDDLSLNNLPTTTTETIIDSSNIDTQVHHDPEDINQTIITMRTDANEIDIHSLLANDIDRVREIALEKLLQMKEATGHSTNETITLSKLNKLPKSVTWKSKHVFGVPLRIYQQTTGHLLPIGIINALEYILQHAGKCDGLFRKPGVKSKIDHLRGEIERIDCSLETIPFDQYPPYVIADVIRQYFRELPECLIPPSMTRFLADLLQSITPEEQLLAVRYTFLILPDETREVLQILLRFLFNVSIRLGNNQTTCRSLARIFLPSVFQSYYIVQQTSSKIFWWKWKKEKSNGLQQENERLVLEQCLMTMIFNVDLLCRLPSVLADELQLPRERLTKKLDELVRNECNGEFQLKKYISKKTEQFLQKLSNTKFKTVPMNLDGVHVSVHKPSTVSSENYLPQWKCSIEIPNSTVKQVQQRLLYERYLWDQHFAEGRTIEKIYHDKEILQYVLNAHDFTSVRSFCEFRYSKKVASRSPLDIDPILISSISIDHLQNHFLPGHTGRTYEMDYYLTPSPHNSANTIITQIACVDYSGRSSQWYENLYGSLLAHQLISLRDSFIKTNSS